MINPLYSSFNALPMKQISKKMQEENKAEEISFKGTDNSNKPITIGINGGTGRIGKTLFREWAATELDAGTGVVPVSINQFLNRAKKTRRLDVVAINVGKRMSEEGLVYAFQFDTAMGNFPGKLRAERDKKDDQLYLIVKKDENSPERRIKIYEQRSIKDDPKTKKSISWDADVVIDTTGKYRTKAQLTEHINAGAKKAICSCPAKEVEVKKDGEPVIVNGKKLKKIDVDNTIVYGINHDKLKPTDKLISNASCTTTCIAPIIKVLNDTYGVESGFIQTTHSATQSQFILDKSVDEKTDDLAKNRGSFDSIIPTTTGAAKAIGLVIPELNGKLNGLAARVPTNDVSVAYVVLNLKPEKLEGKDSKVALQEIKDTLDAATKDPKYTDILAKAPKGATSRDMLGRHESSLYVEDQIQLIGENMVAIPAFYDNEWGYTRSLMDLARLAGIQHYDNAYKESQPGQRLKITA
jgi:glyceraldehyde 3-phosphate dehydrogenase